MSNFSQYRLTDAEMREKGVVSAPDRLTGTAQENKALFDRLVRESVSMRFNELLDALELRAESLGRGANLLDNAYFIGGGSQQGGGQFPINQRGQPSYSNAGYGIDRWSSTRNNTVTPEADGLKFEFSTGQDYQQISQSLRNFEAYKGKTFTFSAIVVDCTGNFYMRAAYASGGQNSFNREVSAGTAGLVSLTFTLPIGATTFGLQFSSGKSKPTTGYFKIAAVKLELGTQQTLARNVGTEADPQWVLNDPPPNYQQELAKCQRYFQVFRTQSLRPTYGMDFRPPMAADEPTLGSFVLDNVTYYTASA